MRMFANHPSQWAVLILLLGAFACGALPAGAAAPVGEDGKVTFSFRAPDAGAVYVAGDFNGWNATDTAMERGDDGVWTAVVELDPGAYEYKFVVDDQWREDPDNPEKKSDPFGGSNSVVKVAADGSIGARTAPAAKPSPAPTAGDVSLGRPRAVEGGILFTYSDPNAGGVFLAGSFNEWNATALPLALGEDGLWSLVHPLPAGKHEYKFVVDGAWLADPENPDTQADPYGGANSLVTIDDGGNLIASAAAEDEDAFRSNTSLNARVNMNGRYLTRFEMARGLYGDPRYRMQRPQQSVDLNFDTQVSDVAHTMFRLRMDSGQNIIQNNIAAFMDEAYLEIKPRNFSLKAFWNQEMFTGEDPMRMGGDVDLPGTIGPDHLGFGKGANGFLFESDPFGLHLRGFFSNVYNQDYYNDPDLYDNTGEDRIGVRISREEGRFEIGLPVYVERSVIGYEFSSYVEGDIPPLDEHLAGSDDPSDWYTIEDHVFNTGLDLRYRVRDNLKVAGEAVYIDEFQGIIWGNKSGVGESAEAVDVPFFDRNQVRFRFQADWQPATDMNLMAQHTWGRAWGGDSDDRAMNWTYQDQATAGGRVYYEILPAPAELDDRVSEVEFDWHTERRDLKIWAWHRDNDYDFGTVGRSVPSGTDDQTMLNTKVSYVSVNFGAGLPADATGRGELELGVHLMDPDVGNVETDFYEMIFRYDVDLTRRTGFIADIRYINFPHGQRGGSADFLASNNDYVAPFVGFRYRPIRTLDLVLAYGIDPVDFTVDYDGRQIGRWWYRQQFLFDNPDATMQDAESHLADARVITLRAQYRF